MPLSLKKMAILQKSFEDCHEMKAVYVNKDS